MSHEISPISTAVNVRVLTMGPKVSGFLLGFNLEFKSSPIGPKKVFMPKSERLRVPRDSFRTLFTTTLSVTGLEDNAKTNRDMAVR